VSGRALVAGLLAFAACWAAAQAQSEAKQASVEATGENDAQAAAIAGETQPDTEVSAADQPDDSSGRFSPEVEKILSQPSAPEDYGTTETCIPVRSIRDTQILDDRHVVFRLPGQKLYLVEFKHRCMQMRPESTLVMEPRGSRLCRMDSLRASNSFSTGSMGPPCSIPGFVQVTEEQVSLLKETLAAKRRRGRDASSDKPGEPPPESTNDRGEDSG
jgi:hypothetical protein